MNLLVEKIDRTVRRFGKCTQIHLVDTGGDVMMNVLGPSIEEGSNPRGERDVWNLVMALALQERFGCKVQLIVVAPGIDGQSLWLGPFPPAKKGLHRKPTNPDLDG